MQKSRFQADQAHYKKCIELATSWHTAMPRRLRRPTPPLTNFSTTKVNYGFPRTGAASANSALSFSTGTLVRHMEAQNAWAQHQQWLLSQAWQPHELETILACDEMEELLEENENLRIA